MRGRKCSPHAIVAIVAAIIIVATVSCNTNGCLDNQSSIPLAGFYASESKSAATFDSLSIYGLGVPGDTLILECGTSASQVYLPFDMSNDVTRYIISYGYYYLDDESYNDTLTFCYNRVPFFVSADCGAMYYFDITDYYSTTHLIDSIVVNTDRITNVDIETVEIYFRVDDDDDDDDDE